MITVGQGLAGNLRSARVKGIQTHAQIRGSVQPGKFGLEFTRQALHAAALELVHPRSGKLKSWSAPLPADMKKLLAALRHDA